MSHCHEQRVATGFDAVVLGHEVVIEFTRHTVLELERYGDDADGRRGEWRWGLDRDEAERIAVGFYAGYPFRMTPLEKFVLRFRQAVEDAVAGHIETTEAEIGEDDRDDGPEREEDR